jgi:uncharacterized membrane protein (DUF485 family)
MGAWWARDGVSLVFLMRPDSIGKDFHPQPPVPCGPGCTIAIGAVERSPSGMPTPDPKHTDFIHSEEFLAELQRRQFRLSVLCAASFLTALLALPALNYFLPGLMATRIGGFPFNWLLLGVLFFPLVWVISWVFIQRSIALENQEAETARRHAANEARR